jgi:hypothetical protein
MQTTLKIILLARQHIDDCNHYASKEIGTAWLSSCDVTAGTAAFDF